MKVCPHCGKQYPDSMTLCSADATALRSINDPLLDDTLAGKYRIEQLIKRGGMGAVYRGKHVLMDKTVAIKVLRPSLAADHEVVARFSREAKAASRLSHPHAVTVTDFGEAENGVVFLVMEYLDGRTLKDVIKSDGPMPLARAIEIMRQVAGALDAAHAEGVIHRDLKTDNIMLEKHDGGDWVKVLDFGIAKIKQRDGARDADLTSPDLIIGTPHYMSPEQCAGSNAIDARADVYSLGVILFEMLTGKVPFTGESPTAIMMKQAQEPPPSLLSERPDLPIGTAEVVARALAKRPEDRFQTAGELSGALSRAAGRETGVGSGTVGSAGRIGAHALPDGPDETTLVQRRPPQPRLHSAVPARQEPARFNRWRIIVPSIVALPLIFLAVFLLTRNPAPQQNQLQSPNQPGLSADPNSQPVQPAGPPTGESEQGIQTNAIATPSANANANVKSPSPANNFNDNFPESANENQNTSERGNKNANQARELPSPKSSIAPGSSSQPTPATPKPSPTSPSATKPKPSPSGN